MEHTLPLGMLGTYGFSVKVQRRQLAMLWILDIVLLTLFFVVPWQPELWEMNYFFLPFAIAGLLATAYGHLELKRNKLLVLPDRFERQGAFRKVALCFGDLKGYFYSHDALVLVPLEPKGKRIRVPLTFEGLGVVEKWLAHHYSDLSVREEQEEEQKIKENVRYGPTPDARMARLHQAKQVCNVLNGFGLLLAGWLVVYPHPWRAVLLASLIVPMVGIVAVVYYRGLARLYFGKGQVYATPIVAVVFPPVGMLAMLMSTVQLIDYRWIWLPSLALAVACMIPSFSIGDYQVRKRYWLILVSFVHFWIYGYGAMVSLNSLTGEDRIKVYQATITNRYTSGSVVPNYNLSIGRWDLVSEEGSHMVSRRCYRSLRGSSTAYLHVRTGGLGGRWFTIASTPYDSEP